MKAIDVKSTYPNGISREVEMTQDDLDENDDVYVDSHEAVPFSSAVATCDKHGMLAKKTKGILRNMKNYHCVICNGMLYLYNKESDERQRKTIDLTGYMARVATGEDIRDQRKKDAAFEIVGPGKKTHTFIARTARDRGEWLGAFVRSIKAGRSKTLPAMRSLSGIIGNLSKDINEFSIPKSTLSTQKECERSGDEDFYYHDVAEEEVYEVIGPEGTVFGIPVENTEVTPTKLIHETSDETENQEDYDPVSPEDIPPPLPEVAPPCVQTMQKKPPERPPLPASMQNRVNLSTTRPLPDAPKDANYNSYDPGGIYCEIEEDSFENEPESTDVPRSFENVNQSASTVDGKKPRAVSADGLPKDTDSLSPTVSSRASTNSLVGSFSEEILMNLSDSNLSQHMPHKYTLRYANNRNQTPPKLPPKGIPYPPVDIDDCEYKVPASMLIDTEYQVPPNPIPTEVDDKKSVHETLGSVPPYSQMYQVPQSQTIVAVKSTNDDKKDAVIEKQSRPLSYLVSEKEDTLTNSKLKALTERFETKHTLGTKDVKDRPMTHGTSVKDMIARLNNNRGVEENDSIVKLKDLGTQATASTVKSQSGDDATKHVANSNSNSVEENRVGKPSLPPRPQNLPNISNTASKRPGDIENKDTLDIAEKITEADDYYETPEGNSFDSSSQENCIASTVDVTAPWLVKSDQSAITEPEKIGEWYVAKFAFVATIDQALSFSRGDLILVHEASGSSGWWKATIKGRSGVVPKEYLKKKDS
ncbi:hypothetical protein SK128_007887 [Halocaridina rubra]|uniref:Uncharacterized protein n=1 Tax=Halocaridina rubra TaxID=373956 RepID=A0AAN8WF07_HALRR